MIQKTPWIPFTKGCQAFEIREMNKPEWEKIYLFFLSGFSLTVVECQELFCHPNLRSRICEINKYKNIKVDWNWVKLPSGKQCKTYYIKEFLK
jgi:hypothetical protein